MSKLKLSVHLRVYRGKTLTYNEKGESTNENHIVKLDYNTPEYKRFLSMLRSNGFIKAVVEKALDLNNKTDKGYEEVKDFSDIQKEVELALNPNGAEKELTADQKRIAALEAKIEALSGGKKEVKDIKVNDSKEVKGEAKEPKKELTEDEKALLASTREEYVKVFGKKGHPGWSVEELNQKIQEEKSK